MFKPVDQYKGPAYQGESTFEFLQRGGRKEAVEIRQWIEKWYKEYPCNKKMELKRRLQSEIYREFFGALFELQVYTILRRLDCFIEVELGFSGTDGTADFRATNNGQKFYIEATVCGIEQGILRSNSNEQDAVQKIKDNLISPHSDIWLDADGELRSTLGTKRIVKPFKDLLDKHPAEEVRRIYAMYGIAGAQRHLSTNITEGDWVLKGWLEPPIASHGRGQIHGPGRGGVVDGVTPLGKALSRKAEDWKKKQLENEIFLIAVNTCHSEFFWGDEKKAIFGHDDIEKHEAFPKLSSSVNSIIVVGNAVLGAERNAPVRMYQNGNKCIPECLQFLLQERRLGVLLGIG